ncbi:MAG TPA: acetolactate synthase small subunit [Euryarchaeota archaeon]|nr:acetolactate synthase small subunit [archaeon BMS3Bbin15]HDL15702.1 acetolactate synthase small subunit [Euryarchaeota archaeon]
MENKTHYIVALVEDKPGVMQRVSGLLSRRNFNIKSISVGATEKPGISRITMTLKGQEEVLEQVIKQLNKLIEVVKVSGIEKDESVIRELVLIKVNTATDSARAEVVQYANIFRGRFVDVAKESMVIEITGDESKINAFIELMRSYGIKEVARTGKTIMTRGKKIVSIKGR